MREDQLLAVQPKSFIATTDSEHELEVYLNLASRMKLTDINQLWVADITYIRLSCEFVFLAVLLDAFSRKVVGWEWDRILAAPSPRAALEKAIVERKPPPGVVHHSDRGVKREEIYAHGYSTLDHLREHIAAFIDSYYNRVRLHSALGYRSPEEFEQAAATAATAPGATLSFLRQEEIFPSDVQP